MHLIYTIRVQLQNFLRKKKNEQTKAFTSGNLQVFDENCTIAIVMVITFLCNWFVNMAINISTAYLSNINNTTFLDIHSPNCNTSSVLFVTINVDFIR